MGLPPSLELVDGGHPLRVRTERFIADRYRQSYGAEVASFMPCLLVMVDSKGEVQAAAGLRCAGQGPLFAEQYLDAPVETLLSQRFASQVSRPQVAEIGHLSGAGNGAGRRFFPLIAAYLQSIHLDWAVFVATAPLRELFERIQLRPLALAPARAERLGSMAAAWGSYYQHDPWVIGGPLHFGRHLLAAGG
ncbi:MAG: thermostable hemolysin [Lysobacterales bacterium]